MSAILSKLSEGPLPFWYSINPFNQKEQGRTRNRLSSWLSYKQKSCLFLNDLQKNIVYVLFRYVMFKNFLFLYIICLPISAILHYIIAFVFGFLRANYFESLIKIINLLNMQDLAFILIYPFFTSLFVSSVIVLIKNNKK